MELVVLLPRENSEDGISRAVQTTITPERIYTIMYEDKTKNSKT